jgi:hypothetical protein
MLNNLRALQLENQLLDDLASVHSKLINSDILILYRDSRTARHKAVTYSEQTYTSIHRMGFESTVAMFERGIGLAVTVID